MVLELLETLRGFLSLVEGQYMEIWGGWFLGHTRSEANLIQKISKIPLRKKMTLKDSLRNLKKSSKPLRVTMYNGVSTTGFNYGSQRTVAT